MSFEGEQVREISQQAPVGTPKPPVGVPPASSAGSGLFFRDGAFGHDVMPSFVPRNEGGREGRLVRCGQCHRQRLEFLGSVEFWCASEIPGHNLHLVEVTHLDREPSLERFTNAFAAVHDEGLDEPSLPFEFVHTTDVICSRFVGDGEPEQISLQRLRPKDHHPHPSTEVEGIGREDNGLRR